MNREALNKIFTEAVAEKIAAGFTICIQTMPGHQGELAKVNFTDAAGNHYSLYMDKISSRWGNKEKRRDIFDTIVLRWVKNKDLKGFIKRWQETLWLDEKHNETLEERTFWVVAENWFVEDPEVAEAAAVKHWAHYKASFERGYRLEFEIDLNQKNRRMVYNIFKKNKQRWNKMPKVTEIKAATYEREGGRLSLRLTIEGKTAKEVVLVR